MTSKPASHSELADDIAGLKQLLASRDQTIRHLQAQVDKLEGNYSPYKIEKSA
ncbi:MAG: hypothetical protein AB2814_11505 [Candidatus Sedimenticola endophacoides]